MHRLGDRLRGLNQQAADLVVPFAIGEKPLLRILKSTLRYLTAKSTTIEIHFFITSTKIVEYKFISQSRISRIKHLTTERRRQMLRYSFSSRIPSKSYKIILFIDKDSVDVTKRKRNGVEICS